MKRRTKLTLVALLVVLFITSTIVLAACDSSKQDALDAYTLDSTVVDADFILPKTIGPVVDEVTGKGEFNVTWKSDNSAIEIVEQENDYLAKVTLGDAITPVKLTAKCGSASRDFEVQVVALDAAYFAEKYAFKQDKATVSEDFALDKETPAIQGKKATISWEVDNEASKNYIAISSDGSKCEVTPSGMNAQVRLRATFSYNGATATMPYRMNVYVTMNHELEIDYWYNNTGVSIDMKGWVVEVGTAWSSQYNNVTFYMVDESGAAGYYLYRAGADEANGSKIKPGAYVTVTGTTNTNYNGLIETNAGGTCIVDESKSISKEDLYKKVYAIDNDLLSGSPATIYHESRLVSLSGWIVKSVPKTKPEGKSNSETLMTLSKEGKEVNVQLSGYLEGAYKRGDKDSEWGKLVALLDTIKVGDAIDITGILGCYQGAFQVLALNADLVKITPAADVVPNVPHNGITAPVAGTYDALALNQLGLSSWLYATGAKSGNFLATTTEISQAAKVTLAQSGDGWTIVIGGKYLEIVNQNNITDGSKVYAVYNDAQSGVWKWDTNLQLFTWTIGTYTYFLGTYNNFNTISPSNISYITGNNAKNKDVTQYTAKIGNANDKYVFLPGVSVEKAMATVHNTLGKQGISKVSDGAIKGNYIVASDTTFSLPTKANGGVTISYKLAWENKYVSLKDGTDSVEFSVKPDKVHEKVSVRIEYKCGEYTTFELVTIETNPVDSDEIIAFEIDDLDIDKTLVQGQDIDLVTAGNFYAGVEITWALDKEYEGITLANGKLVIDFVAPGDVTIKLTATVKHGDKSKTADFSIAIPKLPEIIGDVEIDLISRFPSLGWSSSYMAHEVQVGADLKVNFTTADAQSSTITDRPVVASQNGTTEYVTVTLTGTDKQINSITFNMTQWNTKTLQSMYLEYTTDGEHWTAVENVGFKDKGKNVDDGDFVETLAASGLPAGVIAVRLAVKSDNSSRVQLGIGNITLNVTKKG